MKRVVSLLHSNNSICGQSLAILPLGDLSLPNLQFRDLECRGVEHRRGGWTGNTFRYRPMAENAYEAKEG